MSKVNEILDADTILAGTDAKLTEIGYERLGENIQSAQELLLAEVLDIIGEHPEWENTISYDVVKKRIDEQRKAAKERFK